MMPPVVDNTMVDVTGANVPSLENVILERRWTPPFWSHSSRSHLKAFVNHEQENRCFWFWECLVFRYYR